MSENALSKAHAEAEGLQLKASGTSFMMPPALQLTANPLIPVQRNERIPDLAGSGTPIDFESGLGHDDGADLERYRGAPIGKMGAIAASADQYAAALAQGGMNIRKTPIPSGEVLGQIPVGQKVFAKAENQFGGWAFVVGLNGTAGWISLDYLRTDMPDPEAILHHITEPNLTTILERHYHEAGRYDIGTGNDFATLAVAVAAANQGTQSIYVDADKIQQWLDDNPIRSYDYIADNLAKYSAIGIRSGTNIWLPGASYVKSLQDTGEIATRPDWANRMVEGGKMTAGFVAGFYNGIYENITDTFVGLWEAAKSSMEFLGDLFSGDLFASIPEVAAEIKAYCKGKSAGDILNELMGILGDMASSAWDNFVDNWSHPDEYKRWHFRGNLVGQIVLEVVIAIFTMGGGTAAKWGTKLVSLSPKLAGILTKVALKARKLKPQAKGVFKGASEAADELEDATDGRAAQKAKAYAWAKGVTEFHDANGSGLAELKASLSPIERKYKVRYKEEPKAEPGHYRILQLSPKVVDEDFSAGKKDGNRSKEIFLDKVSTYEQARNKAMELLGSLEPGSQPMVGRLKMSLGYQKVIGRQSADRKAHWRLDFDPDKGIHINVADFREGKQNAKKYVIPFEGDEATFATLLKHLNK